MWKCSCGIVNSGLNKKCAGINQAILNYSGEHKRITENLYDIHEQYVFYTRPMKWLDEVTPRGESVTEPEDLFRKFFNHELILVQDMDSITFLAHKEELALIALETKARLTAVDKHEREKNAKLKVSQKEWLAPTEASNHLVTDAINVVKERKQRMSKAEKLSEQLKKLNLPDDVRKQMMRNVEKNATESQMNLATFVAKKTEERVQEIKEESKPQIVDWSFLDNK